MKSDIEIARETDLRKIKEVATTLGIPREEVQNYGRYIAKVPIHLIDKKQMDQHNLILVTAITPTKAGIGKTTVSIGLALGLNKIGKKAVVALREPSLGPCFGMKGGAAGGGYAQVLPMENINLHFTGDFHAVTSAHNMITALLDNYIYQTRNTCEGLKEIKWKRVLDVNDRSLRNIVSGLGGSANGVPTETGFDITPASEIMAILCLATDIEDLKRRVGNILLGYTNEDKPFTVNDLGIAGAITVLLKDALLPNLVQTTENTPAFVHGGPFANIAHGCNSISATQMALTYGDYVITEAGFGADLGAEKFFNIKCRKAGLSPKLTVIVATAQSLKLHGGVPKEAAQLVKDITFSKFDASLDIDVRLGVDPRKANQMVRGVVSLPHGTGKQVRVLVLCTPDAEAAAKEAGADYVGLDEYIEKIKGGWTDIDVIITMPSIMGKIGALGRVLGPRGLMPNPKSGTVTMDVAKAVKEVKQGKIDFKVDKSGIVHTSIGKVSFTADQIRDNAKEFIATIIKLKPSSAKGTYIKSIYLSSTMSKGIKIDPKTVEEN